MIICLFVAHADFTHLFSCYTPLSLSHLLSRSHCRLFHLALWQLSLENLLIYPRGAIVWRMLSSLCIFFSSPLSLSLCLDLVWAARQQTAPRTAFPSSSRLLSLSLSNVRVVFESCILWNCYREDYLDSDWVSSLFTAFLWVLAVSIIYFVFYMLKRTITSNYFYCFTCFLHVNSLAINYVYSMRAIKNYH